MLRLWVAAIAVELVLVAELAARWRFSLFWWWLVCNAGVSLAEWFLRGNGPVYSALWLTASPALSVLLVAAVASDLRPRASAALVAAGCALAATVALSTEHRWPDSPMESVEAFVAAGHVFCCALLVQHRLTWFQRVTAAFCGLSAVAFYAAPAFNHTIGRAVEGIELAAAVGWLLNAVTGCRSIGKSFRAARFR